MSFLVNSIKHLRKKLYQFATISWSIEAEELLPNSFCEASIMLIPKLDENILRKNYRPMSETQQSEASTFVSPLHSMTSETSTT